MREIAIISMENGANVRENIVSKLKNGDRTTVFCFKDSDLRGIEGVETIEIPEDMRKREAAVRNFVSRHYIGREFCGFLHVISDKVEILKDPSGFMDKIEEMMSKLKLKSWFNTITDPCNYTFKTYNPRFSVTIDREDAKKAYDKTVYFTSHANTSWMCYDFSVSEYEDVRFEDRFTIPMFYIIEFLARRRNNKKSGELYYMNMYPTIEDERGVFRMPDENFPPKERTEDEIRQEQVKMSEENRIFQEMKVNNSADMGIEQIIEDLYNILVP